MNLVSRYVLRPSALLIALAVCWPAQVSGATFQTVTMIFVGGEQCVALDKPTAEVFRFKKPRRVKWVVTVPGRYWEIRYDPATPGKAQGQGNFFSNSPDLDISCTGNNARTELPTGLQSANANWPYMIKVYECEGGVKKELICELDPEVIWGD